MAFGRKPQDPEAGTTPPAEAAPASADVPAAAPAPAATPARSRKPARAPAGGDQLAMRLVATAGIVGIGVAIGAILVGQNVAGWITGLVVTLAAMVLMAVVWGARRG